MKNAYIKDTSVEEAMLLKYHSEKLFLVPNRNRTLKRQVNYLHRVRK